MLPSTMFGLLQAPLLFRRPFRLIRHYVGRTTPTDRLLETRQGLRIHLSGDQDDVVTVFLNFSRCDYGEVRPGSVVVDVGGHLGAFTLFAVSQGAATVYCYEPDPELYQTILKNIASNGLEQRIHAFNAAVSEAVGTLSFRREGNASGHVVAVATETDVTVRSVSLEELMTVNRIERLDLLKLDCEGSEYGIIATTPRNIWERIDRVRLEYHDGRADELKRQMTAFGYHVVHQRALGNVGLIWFNRTGVV